MSHDTEEAFEQLVDDLRDWLLSQDICLNCAISAMGSLTVEFICQDSDSFAAAVEDGADFCNRITQHIKLIGTVADVKGNA